LATVALGRETTTADKTFTQATKFERSNWKDF
jgi:hypothetical protein